MNLKGAFLMFQVLSLITLQVCSVVVLWSLNALNQASTDAFALFLSIDVLAFVLTSYLYRSYRAGSSPHPTWVSAGYLALVVLLVSMLAVV